MTGFLSKNPLAFEELTVADTAVGLTFGIYLDAQVAFMTVEEGEMRIRFDGGNPTATVGHIVNWGDIINLGAGNAVSKFKAIRTGATSGKLIVSYFG